MKKQPFNLRRLLLFFDIRFRGLLLSLLKTGYFLVESQWGQGIAAEATRIVDSEIYGMLQEEYIVLA